MHIPQSASPSLNSEAERRDAIRRRDAGADGAFVYAVRTTGVYCRPSCPSRSARAENIELFDTPKQAAAAGYRACRRCQPEGPSQAERDAALVARACRLIEEAEEIPSLDEMAEALETSVSWLHRRFRMVTGLTPKAYATAHRARRLRAELGTGEASITRAIYDAGFNASSRYYEASGALLGMTATTWRKGGEGVDIRFAIGQCSLGAILVARSPRGVCAILLGDDPEELIHTLQDRFPRAGLIGDDPEFDRLVATVVGFVEHPGRGLDLPLDMRGTAFQQRVWQALRQIPAGETVSYAEIARRIGAPSATRAVAQACGANSLAVAVPCHRVVRTDGALSGYRWGVERKRRLLDREAAA